MCRQKRGDQCVWESRDSSFSAPAGGEEERDGGRGDAEVERDAKPSDPECVGKKRGTRVSGFGALWDSSLQARKGGCQT